MMHKIYLGFVVMGLLLSSPAYAGGWTVSSGKTNHDVNQENFAKSRKIAVADTEFTTDDTYFSYGYMWDDGIEISSTVLGSVEFKDNDAARDPDGYAVYRYHTISGIDASYNHAVALNNGMKLRLRVGYHLDATLAEEGDDGEVYGVGLSFKRIFIDYKFYVISIKTHSTPDGGYTYDGTYETYSGASVIAVGYQF